MSEKDANPQFLSGKTVAVLGYGAQGRAQAIMLQKSGVSVIVGLREMEQAEGKQKKMVFLCFLFAEAA